MIPVIAVPIIHSSGAWIASTAAGGYVSGTLSSTWIGSFVLGNSGILGALGFTGLASTGAFFGGGAIATWLGLAPPTFLGLSALGWTTGGAGLFTVAASISIYKKVQVRKALMDALPNINSERAKNGDYPFSFDELIDELKKAEEQAIAESYEIANRILIDYANDPSKLTVRTASGDAIDKDKMLANVNAARAENGTYGIPLDAEKFGLPTFQTYFKNDWHDVLLGEVRYVVDKNGERIVEVGIFSDSTVLMITPPEEMQGQAGEAA